MMNSLNTKFKNDYTKTESFILETLRKKEISPTEIQTEINAIFDQLQRLGLNQLLPKFKPPTGY